VNTGIFPYGVRPDSPEWVSHSDPCVERVRVMVAWHNLVRKYKIVHGTTVGFPAPRKSV
jgi:hypothetical protein